MPIRRDPNAKVSVISLNPQASLLWSALEHPSTTEELVARLTAEFEVSTETARTDVTAFLGELESAGLVSKEGES